MHLELKNWIGNRCMISDGRLGEVIDCNVMKDFVSIRLDDMGAVISRISSKVALLDEDGLPVRGHITPKIIQHSEENELAQKKKAISNFGIDQKFDYMSKFVQMVIQRTSVSLVITGEGGLGKTYTVNKEIEKSNLLLGDDFIVIKGYSTAKGLFRSLYEHQEKLIIFDDCDAILENENAKQILKSALDSYDQRIISWISQAPVSDLPETFEFFGQIIFISNKKQDQIDQALLSRSFTIDLSMSPTDKIQRMRTISKAMFPALEQEYKDECIDFIEIFKDICNDLNMRTFIKCIKVRQTHPDDWKNLVEYIILSQ